MVMESGPISEFRRRVNRVSEMESSLCPQESAPIPHKIKVQTVSTKTSAIETKSNLLRPG
jgi:hypothetical protein